MQNCLLLLDCVRLWCPKVPSDAIYLCCPPSIPSPFCFVFNGVMAQACLITWENQPRSCRLPRAASFVMLGTCWDLLMAVKVFSLWPPFQSVPQYPLFLTLGVSLSEGRRAHSGAPLVGLCSFAPSPLLVSAAVSL